MAGSDWTEKAISIVVAFTFPSVLLGSFAVNLFGGGASRLEVVASTVGGLAPARQRVTAIVTSFFPDK